MQAAWQASNSLVSNTSVLLTPQNRLSVKTWSAKYSDVSKLSQYFTYVEAIQ